MKISYRISCIAEVVLALWQNQPVCERQVQVRQVSVCPNASGGGFAVAIHSMYRSTIITVPPTCRMSQLPPVAADPGSSFHI